jgi:hypothetical protein
MFMAASFPVAVDAAILHADQAEKFIIESSVIDIVNDET